ncbi:MAG: tetratricopeptide repeat protein [Verrucomicrobiota bacterium]
MRKSWLIPILLFVVCLSFATYLQPRQPQVDTDSTQPGGALSLLLGDGRKMFANEVYAKADAYFHRGNYPSIFELNARKQENHMVGEAAVHDEHETEAEHGKEDHDAHDEGREAPAPARDWIEKFGRHFYPSVHMHLEQGEEREMLPWLRLAAELDPHQSETYTVASYWLRKRLGKVAEAEEFLREGLRSNPGNVEILNELAKLNLENKKDYARARNLWLAALDRWHAVEEKKEKPDRFLLEQILGGLNEVEMAEGHTAQAVEYLKQLKEVSPNPESVQKRIDEAQALLAPHS